MYPVQRPAQRPDRSSLRPGRLWVGGAIAAWAAAAGSVQAQEIEPRAFSNAPVGVNFLIAGYVHTKGSLAFETLPLTNAELSTSNAILSYARVFEVAGQSAKFDMIVPYTWLSGS